MAQIKFNLTMIRQVISVLMTGLNVLLSVIETIERTVQNG